MQTRFTPAQLTDPVIREADAILRKCVHCGFCTATCPTFVLRGDELDSPRGRIYLIKEMYERGGPPPAALVKHLDRCLSCLSCMTTCPSGVDYMHLVDSARQRIEQHPELRPAGDRALRRLLAWVMSSRSRFRLALRMARLTAPFHGLLPARLRAMVELAPARLPEPSPALRPQVFAAEGPRAARVALLTGCVQAVIDTEIIESTVRLLTRHGVEVVVSAQAECCGALSYHMGQVDSAKAKAKTVIDAWWRETGEGGGAGLDAVVINTSGCGSMVKDYGHLFRDDEPALAHRAQMVAALAQDVTELIEKVGLKPAAIPTGQRVAYHSACSLQHGQRIRSLPQALLRKAGFEVREAAEGHLCCGSAGTYNLLQPELSSLLKARKAANLEATEPDMIAAGNIGCLVQIGSGTDTPVVHTVQLLDWATGGPKPECLGG